jgi:hypothetical protein
MAPTLSGLPTELVERIVSRLPNRDSLLHLRRINREHAAKTSRCFAEKYFATSAWSLNSRFNRIMTEISVRPDIVPYMITIRLNGPWGKCMDYDNVILSKGLDPKLLAGVLSRLPRLKSLELLHFEFNGSIHFFHELVGRLVLQRLEWLRLSQCTINHKTLAKLLKEHKQILNDLELDNINLEAKRKQCGHDRPWRTVLSAMLEIENDCGIEIENPKEIGHNAELSLWDDPDKDLNDLSIVCIREDEYDDDTWFTNYQIARDSRWRSGIRYMIKCYEYHVYDLECIESPAYCWESEDE